MFLVKAILERMQGKVPLGKKRSREWPRVRAEHLEKQPTCMVCGSDEVIEVHHIKPFWLAPELELNPANLITLCESKKVGVTCHLAFGHLGSYRSFNPDIVMDAKVWLRKFTKAKKERTRDK